MKIARLKNLEKIVENVLREDRLTRIDDCYLILKVIIKIHPFEAGKTFSEVMLGAKSKGISLESITRTRRKIQREHPELKDSEVADIRDKEQNEYIEYAKEK